MLGQLFFCMWDCCILPTRGLSADGGLAVGERHIVPRPRSSLRTKREQSAPLGFIPPPVWAAWWVHISRSCTIQPQAESRKGLQGFNQDALMEVRQGTGSTRRGRCSLASGARLEQDAHCQSWHIWEGHNTRPTSGLHPALRCLSSLMSTPFTSDSINKGDELTPPSLLTSSKRRWEQVRCTRGQKLRRRRTHRSSAPLHLTEQLEN